MFEFLLKLALFLLGARLPVFLFPFKVVDFLLEHLDVQLELLLHLYMVSHLRLIILQLLLILLGWQVQRVERRRKLTRRPVVDIRIEAIRLLLARTNVLFFFKPELHQVFKLGLDVGQNGETGQVSKARPFVCEFLWLDHVELS